MSKPSTYELSEQVLNQPGSLREIGEALGISKSYASMLKKARANCAAQVQDYWRSGELPWNLVRSLANLSRSEQLPIMRDYVQVLRGDPSKREQKLALKRALERIREARGGMTVATAREIYDEAKALYEDDDCQIDETQKITPSCSDERIEGYWVPASLWVPIDNISTKG